MIRAVIAYDDNDNTLGEYFDASHSDLISELNVINTVTRSSIRGLDCTEMYLSSTIQPFNGNRFIFIGLCHGNTNQLVSHQVFVSQNNAAIFSNSFFYTCACSTGKKLGKLLITQGCLAFIGYSKTIHIIEDYAEVFFRCQNFGIKSFLTNDETILISYKKMVDYYNSEIDRLVIGTTDDVIAASTLVNNLGALIHIGNGDLTRNDFYNA